MKFCSLYSGSSGNCLFVSDGKTKILVDAGLSGKRIIQALSSIDIDTKDIDGILITHEHIDHTQAAGILGRKLGIPIYANAKTWVAMERQIGKLSEDYKKVFTTEKEFEIGSIAVKPFLIPHDAAEPVGFSFSKGEVKITITTDVGHINQNVLENLCGSKFVFLESNHDVEMLKIGPYPWQLKQRILGENGHLSNEMAGNTLVDLIKKGTQKFLLGHLSKDNNFPELAYQTILNILNEKNILNGKDVTFNIAQRDICSEVFTF